MMGTQLQYTLGRPLGNKLVEIQTSVFCYSSCGNAAHCLSSVFVLATDAVFELGTTYRELKWWDLCGINYLSRLIWRCLCCLVCDSLDAGGVCVC